MHIDPGALAESLSALTTPADGDPPELETSIAAVIDATRSLFAVTGVGLMLADASGELRYVGATDEAARVLESVQEELTAGPCVDCFVLGEVVQTDDLAHDERWPELSSRVVPDVVDAVLGVPTRIGGVVVGSFNVYRSGRYEWDSSDVAAVAAHNEVLEGLLGSDLVARRRGVVVEQLQQALDKRIVIERAVGMLMQRHAVPAVVAFGALRRAARDQRRPVADLAAVTLGGGDTVGARLPGADRA